MHAGVNYVQVQPGKMDEAVSIWQNFVSPAARLQKGFRGALMLTDHSTSKAIVIGLWETEADVPATNEPAGYYQEQVAKFAGVIAGPPVRDVYEVNNIQLSL